MILIEGMFNQSVHGACSSKFTTEINGHCYYHSDGNKKKRWDGRTFCENLGGRLGKIYDMTKHGIATFENGLPKNHGKCNAH